MSEDRHAGLAVALRDGDGPGPGPGQPVPSEPIDGEATTTGTGPADASPASAREGGSSRVPVSVVVGGLVALWGLSIGISPLHDNSFLTHLATGRLILDGGGIPRADPYSFTAPGAPWVVQSWLASVAYAGAEELGGLGAIRLLQGLLGAALGAAVWALSARSPSLFARIAVTAAALAAGVQLWSGRPLLFGLLGLALVLLVAEERLDPRWLVPVAWIWVNTHGSFPFALVLLGLLAVGGRLDRGTWGPEVRALGWAGLGIALGALNPLGPRLLVFPALVARKGEAFRQVVEWQAPSYQSYSELVVLGLLLVGVLGLVRRPRWRDALPLVVFGGLALTAQRNAAPLLLVLVPIVAGALPRLGSSSLTLSRRTAVVAGAAIAAVAVVLASTALRQDDADLSAYPVAAAEWMEEEGLWGPEARVVSYDYVGNYREATHGAEARVFFDDRVDMYPLALIDDYSDLLDAAPEWEEVLHRWEATAVLWRSDSPLGGALSRDDGWEVVHRDETWMVAVPVTSEGN